MKRRTEITIETHEVTVLSTSRDTPSNRYCPNCGSHESVWPAAQITGFSRVTGDEVLNSLGENRLHLMEAHESDDLICGNSLRKQRIL